MRDINEIIIHCFATKEGWFRDKPFFEKVAEVKRWHLLRNFNDIGYHYLISREGEVATGRPLDVAGAHTKGHNANSIGISLEGGYGHSRNDDFLDVYTIKQGKALLQLLDKLDHDLGPMMISPHNKYANKECPAFALEAFLASSPIESVIPVTTKGTTFTLAAGGILAALALFWEQFKTLFEGWLL